MAVTVSKLSPIETKRVNEAKRILKKYNFVFYPKDSMRKQCALQLSENCANETEKFGGRTPANYYMTINNNLFSAEKIHICKDCIKEYIYDIDGGTNLERFKKILQIIDVPFFENEFLSAVDSKNDTFGTYYKNIALNHLGECWEDGETERIEEIRNTTTRTPEEIKVFWGEGFDDKEYFFLENELSNWKKTHKCDTYSEILLLKELCILTLDIRKRRSASQAVDGLRKQLQELMKTASVDPAKTNSINAGKSTDRFGVWLSDIENKKPSEWFNDLNKYKDMDGLIPYIKDYIVRPTKNFFTGSKDFLVGNKDLSFKEDNNE